MIIYLEDGSRFVLKKKDFYPLKSVLKSLRKVIIAFISNGCSVYDKNSLKFTNSQSDTNLFAKNIITACIPTEIRSFLTLKKEKVNFLSFISFKFSFKKESEIEISCQKIILFEINRIIEDENKKLKSKIPNAIKKRKKIMADLEKSKLNLKKRISRFTNNKF